MTVGDVRVRRPRRHEGLIQELRDEAGFTTMRDVLLLAAAIGRGQGRRTPFDDSSEPIRLRDADRTELCGDSDQHDRIMRSAVRS